MSTRANIHFVWKDSEKIEANIYRHPDGYPSGLGTDLHRFLDEAGKLNDSRFSDPEYLAAKFLVWQANEYRTDYNGNQKNLLDFLSVAPCIEDHGDIDFRYKVVCGNGRPEIYVQPANRHSWTLIESAKAAETINL